MENITFCTGGGCTAKLGPAVLERVLGKLPRPTDPNLLVGTESSDDGAVYRLTDDIAIIQTTDFFPPMLDDPYRFGQVAATNALSDVYAMGGEVKTALNIVCFPEAMDLNILGQILQGGQEKVAEAGGVLVGGHSIADSGVKYGLAVTGVVHPHKILRNNGGQPGDALILTKPLGVGIVCTANRVGLARQEDMNRAVESMTTLNKYAAEISRKFTLHACTDVTGFSLLGHLHEMVTGQCSAHLRFGSIPVLPGALEYASQFLTTAAGQRNRNFLAGKVRTVGLSYGMEEVLYDPQTSGGLLLAVPEEEAEGLMGELQELNLPSGRIGRLVPTEKYEITVRR
jgi:selenide,water dikinase